MKTGDQKKKLESAARTIAESQPRHRRVLLVESDPDLQWSMARMLTVNGNRAENPTKVDGCRTAGIFLFRGDDCLVTNC